MSYNAAKHEVFSQRVQNAMVILHDVINREMETLDDIYNNETASGTDAAFTDTDIATEAEHVEAITAIRAFQTTLAAQLSNITPWLQG